MDTCYRPDEPLDTSNPPNPNRVKRKSKKKLKITDKKVDSFISTLNNNKSDDGTLMYIGGTFPVSDEDDASFYINLMCSKKDPSRFGKAVDILVKKHPQYADTFNAIKDGFNVIMNEKVN
jgi:hypothetical protein